MTEKKAQKISWVLHFFNDLSFWFLVGMTLFVGFVAAVYVINWGHPIVEPVCVVIVGMAGIISFTVMYRAFRVARRYLVIRYANNDATTILYGLIEKSGAQESVVHLFDGTPQYVHRHETVVNGLRLSIAETVNINGKDFVGHVFADFRYVDQGATLKQTLANHIFPRDYEAHLKDRCVEVLSHDLREQVFKQTFLYPPAASKELRTFFSSWKLPEDCSDLQLAAVQTKFVFVPPAQEWLEEITLN